MRLFRGKNLVEGELVSFQGGEGSLYVELRNGITVEYRGLADKVVAHLNKLGMRVISKSDVNLDTGVVSANQAEVPRNIMTEEEAKKRVEEKKSQ